MKKVIRGAVALLLFGPLTISADPFKTFNWSGPSTYVNGNPIIADPLTFKLYCGEDETGPYPVQIFFDLQTPPSLQDMAFVVMGPGTYYCVNTATSTLYATESSFSNEVSFTVTPVSQGFVPLPPILGIE